MFNGGMQGVSVLTYSLMNSLKELTEANTFSTTDTGKVQFVNDIGDIYFPMDTNMKMKGQSSPGIEMPDFIRDWDEELGAMEYPIFIDIYLNDNVTTINYNRSMYLPTLLSQLADNEKVYGVIIQNEKYMINPFHPLVAFAITTNMMQYPDEGQLHIFEWSDYVERQISRPTRDAKKAEETFEKKYEKIFETFDHLIKRPMQEKHKASVNSSEVEALVSFPLLEDLDLEIKVEINQNGSSDGIKSILVPAQLAIGDTAIPYYGLMFIDHPRNSGKGFNLTGMMSGNLNQGFDDIDTFYDSVNYPSSGNVCTGSESASNPKGWFTLSKVNINSMFGQRIISENDLVPFATVSKNIAGTIWKGIESTGLKEMEEKLQETEEDTGGL